MRTKALAFLWLLLLPLCTGGAPRRFKQQGTASWYFPKKKHVKMYGKTNGKVYLAAHRTIRPSSVLLVKTLDEKKQVKVTVCGWGPAKWTGCVLDLSPDAFMELAPLRRGHVKVKLEVLHPAVKRRKTSG